jgi:hypothetical protein
MKKILISLIVVLNCAHCFSQGSLTINYTAPAPSCTLTVTVYASCSNTITCPAACDQFVSNVITFTAGGTKTWCDPIYFQAGTGTCVGGAGGVGWISEPSCGDFSTTTDFRWNGAQFSYTGSGCPGGTCSLGFSYSQTGRIEDTCCYASAHPFWGGSTPCPGGGFMWSCLGALGNIILSIH